MSIPLILDIVIVVAVLMFVIIGICNGFIKSIVQLVGFALSSILAAILSKPLAGWLYTTFFYTRVEALVAQKVQQGVADASTTLAEQIEAVIASMPEAVQSLVATYGMDVSGMTGAAQTSDALVPTIMDSVVSPLCTAALQVIVFLVLFFVLVLIIGLLGKLMDAVFSSLPVIKQANRMLGGVLGFAEGVLLVFVLCFALQLYMTLAGAGSLITMDHIEQTHLLEFAMNINPFN